MAKSSGIGTYIRHLVPTVIRELGDWHFTLIGRDDDHWRNLPNATLRPASAAIYSIREQLEIPLRVPRGADLLWVPHYNAPLVSVCPLLLTIHDLAHLRLPEHAGITRRAYARILFRHARSAAGLMFDSEFTRQEFLDLVGNPSGVANVIPLGVAPSWAAAPTQPDASPVDRPYFVYVGNFKPHKNLRVLLDAFADVRREADVRLVLIGQTEGMRTGDRATIRRVQETPDVHLAGEVSNETLHRYLRHAVALVLPSRYEGFGLPPLEAMASGCAAIVARAGSLPEVCGDAARYFPPENVHALSDTMLELLGNQEARLELVRRGRMHARKFDWGITAAKTCGLLEHLVATSRKA